MDIRAGFWQPRIDISDQAAFQVVLTCSETVHVADLPFAAMHVSFSDERPDVIVKAAGNADFVDVGDVPTSGATHEADAALTWKAGRRLVVSGKILNDTEGEVQVGLWTIYPEMNTDKSRSHRSSSS